MLARLNAVKPAFVTQAGGKTSAMVNIDRKEGPPASKAESILAAAKRSFLAAGFGAVSMDAIAREAGVSKATVYAHFAGKEELFGAVVGRECERYLARFSPGELDPGDVRASLSVLGRRFLELILAPDGVALYRIILGEVTRFPMLGEVFWRAGPERQRLQIEAFLKSATASGTLALADTRLAAEQFVSLVRGEIQLRHLLRREADTDEPGIDAVVEEAVATFMRAFERRNVPELPEIDEPFEPARSFAELLTSCQGRPGDHGQRLAMLFTEDGVEDGFFGAHPGGGNCDAAALPRHGCTSYLWEFVDPVWDALIGYARFRFQLLRSCPESTGRPVLRGNQLLPVSRIDRAL
jgi:TetR/AcrR family transcriptional repressor of mexJK operon